ncbi:hypothetical protein L3476_10945 [Paenibacillus thiaminolyticus]|nr:hypothetical protein [Paenibacillus thiaminolyticus]NGP62449.1 hypothetical protein [Paenibacillus thiaminolyticus]WCR29184.1 hypothetical protein L3476_10945 [Paenibacillus thiaminolyticus]
MKTSILFYDLEGKNVVANNLECVDLPGPEISALLLLLSPIRDREEQQS